MRAHFTAVLFLLKVLLVIFSSFEPFLSAWSRCGACVCVCVRARATNIKAGKKASKLKMHAGERESRRESRGKPIQTKQKTTFRQRPQSKNHRSQHSRPFTTQPWRLDLEQQRECKVNSSIVRFIWILVTWCVHMQVTRGYFVCAVPLLVYMYLPTYDSATKRRQNYVPFYDILRVCTFFVQPNDYRTMYNISPRAARSWTCGLPSGG